MSSWRWTAEQVLRAPIKDVQKLIAYCQHNSLLCQFPSSSQIKMSHAMELIDCKRHTSLFNQGDSLAQNAYFYIVLKGKLVIYTNAVYELERSANESIQEWWMKSGGQLNNIDLGTMVGHCGRDAVCGENLLKIESRSSSVLTSEDSTLVRIPLQTLWNCLKEHPETIITSKSILKILLFPPPPVTGRSKGDAIYLSGWMKQLRFFSQLPPNVLLLCAKHCYMKRFANGTIIDEHHENERMRNIHVIIKGTVELRLVNNQAKINQTQKDLNQAILNQANNETTLIKEVPMMKMTTTTVMKTVDNIQKKHHHHGHHRRRRHKRLHINNETSSEEDDEYYSSNGSISSSSCSSYDSSSSLSSSSEDDDDEEDNHEQNLYQSTTEALDRDIGPVLTALTSGDSWTHHDR